MPTLPGLRLSRRAILAGVAASVVPLRLAHGQAWSDDATVDGDCEDEPTIRLLTDWTTGVQVYPTIGEMAPPPDWVPFPDDFVLLPYAMPPDWTGIVLQADTFTESAMPVWQERRVPNAALTAARIISPDGNAVWEYVLGTVGGIVDADLAASAATQGILGEDPDVRRICEIVDPAPSNEGNWFRADRSGRDLIVTSGYVLPSPAGEFSATTVTWTTIFGPRREMEDLTYDVFLRMQFQFLGGDIDPTPTPTP